MRAQPQVSKSLAQVSDYSTVVSLQFSINFQEILKSPLVVLASLPLLFAGKHTGKESSPSLSYVITGV